MKNNIKYIPKKLPDDYKILLNYFLDNSFESFFIVDDNKIVYSNNSGLDLLYPESDELENISFSNLFFPLEKKMIDNFFHSVSRETISEFNELLRLQKKNNTIIYCEIKIKPVDIKGQYIFIVFANDVTKNIKSDQITTALYSIAKAVNITNSIENLYKEIHLAISKVIDVKNFFIAIYYEKNDIIDFPFFLDEKDEKFTIVNASDKRSLTASVIRKNKPLFMNEQNIRNYFSNGLNPWGTLSKVWIAVPLRIENKVIGAIGAQSYNNPNLYSKNDINLFETLAEQIAISIAWKFAEDKLKLSEEKFKKIFKTSPDSILISRLKDGLYVEINKGFTELTGFTEEDVIGKTALEINIWYDPKDRELLVTKLKEDGVCKNLEAKFRLKNGDIITELVSAAIITLHGEQHILSVTRNIQEIIDAREKINKLNLELELKVIERTAQLSDVLEDVREEVEKRKAIQIDLERYQKELAKALESEKELNKLKSKFLSLVSHEYRTPLTIIYTSAELLDKYYNENNYENHKKHTDRILSTVDDMIKLINDVLDVGRNDIVNININYQKINIVENLQQIINTHKITDKEMHSLSFDFSNKNIILETDEILFNLIISNLLTNAFKYTPAGKNIDISVQEYDSYVSIKISDDGIGIPLNDQANIFEHFYRAGNVDDIIGTGLGLSIVKRNVLALNGNISFTSVVNEGTTFNLKFPKNRNLI